MVICVSFIFSKPKKQTRFATSSLHWNANVMIKGQCIFGQAFCHGLMNLKAIGFGTGVTKSRNTSYHQAWLTGSINHYPTCRTINGESMRIKLFITPSIDLIDLTWGLKYNLIGLKHTHSIVLTLSPNLHTDIGHETQTDQESKSVFIISSFLMTLNVYSGHWNGHY